MRVDDHISSPLYAATYQKKDCDDVMEVVVCPRVPAAPTRSPIILTFVVD